MVTIVCRIQLRKNGEMLISQPISSCLTNHSELCMSRLLNPTTSYFYLQTSAAAIFMFRVFGVFNSDDKWCPVAKTLSQRCAVQSVTLRPYSICRIWIQIHSESGFGFTSKSNGLDSWVLSEVTSLLFVYVCILMSLPTTPTNPDHSIC